MLKLTPITGDFGSVEVGKTSAMPQVFVLSNVGSGVSGTPMVSVSVSSPRPACAARSQ